MLKDIAREYFIDRNYNCAESVLRAANDFYGLELHDRDMILVGGYGGGIQCGSTCGALLGGVAALSMMFIKTKAHESEDIKEVVNLFLDKSKAVLESTLCSDIKPRLARPEIRCYETVRIACECLESTLEEYRRSC